MFPVQLEYYIKLVHFIQNSFEIFHFIARWIGHFSCCNFGCSRIKGRGHGMHAHSCPHPPSLHCRHSGSYGNRGDFTLKELCFCFLHGLSYSYLHYIFCFLKKIMMDKKRVARRTAYTRLKFSAGSELSGKPHWQHFVAAVLGGTGRSPWWFYFPRRLKCTLGSLLSGLHHHRS